MVTRKSNNTQHLIIQLFSILPIILILSFGLYHIANARSAEAKSSANRELSFTSVFITSDDTLWSIAKEHYTEEYGSINNYIKEIKRCNSLTTDDINAGSSLLVPVYISVESPYLE